MQPPHQQTPPHIEEDEIDLRELFGAIWQARTFITKFVAVTILLTLIYLLAQPNQYTVKSTLVPIEQKSGGSLGSLGALASMAGVSVDGGEVSPAEAFNILLTDYGNMAKWIKKEQWHKALLFGDDTNYLFAFGYRGIYDLLRITPKDDGDEAKQIYDAYMSIAKSILSVSDDKKTGMLTISATHPDREFAQKILLSFLKEASIYLIQNDLKNNQQQLEYYRESLEKVSDIQIRNSIAAQVSALIQSSIVLKSSPHYKVKMITEPTIPYIADKTKPKRGLILVVAMVTSFILAIFIVFFRNFLRSSSNETANEHKT